MGPSRFSTGLQARAPGRRRLTGRTVLTPILAAGLTVLSVVGSAGASPHGPDRGSGTPTTTAPTTTTPTTTARAPRPGPIRAPIGSGSPGRRAGSGGVAVAR